MGKGVFYHVLRIKKGNIFTCSPFRLASQNRASHFVTGAGSYVTPLSAFVHQAILIFNVNVMTL